MNKNGTKGTHDEAHGHLHQEARVEQVRVASQVQKLPAIRPTTGRQFLCTLETTTGGGASREYLKIRIHTCAMIETPTLSGLIAFSFFCAAP
jgi:hypothetical protein